MSKSSRTLGQPAFLVFRQSQEYPWLRPFVMSQILDEGLFCKRRFTNFCHRYNTAARKFADGGLYVIHTEDARYHDYGNEAD
jgi:hypothetical protein